MTRLIQIRPQPALGAIDRNAAAFRIIPELCFWIAKDRIETRCLQFSDPQQIELGLRDLTGKLFDDLSAAVALKRRCQGLERYALFALVGIAGEDDLDAPDLLPEPSPTMKADIKANRPTNQGSRNGTIHS